MRSVFLILFLICLFDGFEKRSMQIQEIPNVFAKSKLKLEMIFDKKAKINGRWYGIGQEIGDLKIKAIELNYVVLMDAKHQEIVLEL